MARQATTGLRTPIHTSLPVAPTDGQEIRYLADAANGIVWDLRYRAASASPYKWEVIGGSPLTASDDTGITTASAAYIDGSPAISIIAPLAGDYMIAHGMGQIDHTGADYAQSATQVNGTDGLGGTGVQEWGNSGNAVSSAAIERRVNAVTLSTTIKQRYKSNSGVASARFFRRWLRAMPVRVG